MRWGVECELGNRHVQAGNLKVRGQIAQGLEHERALVQTWMGDYEILVVDLLVAIDQDVEVDGSRSPANTTGAPHVPLDGLETSEQRVGIEARRSDQREVEVRR